MKLAAVAVAAAALYVAACSPKSVMVHRPKDPGVDAAVTALWAQEIANVAEDGDWLLTRSYYAVGDVISIATRGEDLSHASMYDAKRDMVVEAVGSGVRELPLAEFLERNHYVIVVRPSRMTADERRAALSRARTQLGVPFDMRGMIGLNNPNAFYCSELVFWASDTEQRMGEHETVVTPADLLKYGQVVYWSGKRDDVQVMKLATARRAERTVAARM